MPNIFHQQTDSDSLILLDKDGNYYQKQLLNKVSGEYFKSGDVKKFKDPREEELEKLFKQSRRDTEPDLNLDEVCNSKYSTSASNSKQSIDGLQIEINKNTPSKRLI